MENQHRHIKGYKELSQADIDAMNEVKQIGVDVLSPLLDKLMADESTDKRWVAIGKTHLQQGLMALTRSITKPDFL